MNILAGELQPDSGRNSRRCRRDQKLPSALAKPRPIGIRIVFQELSLCDNLSVGENVLLSAFAARRPLSIPAASPCSAGQPPGR